MSPATLGCRFFRTATGTEPVREWLRGLEFRVMFYIDGSATVLLHGFQSKTQATPKAELALAKTRKREDRDE